MYKNLVSTHVTYLLLLISIVPIIVLVLHLLKVNILPKDDSGAEVAKLLLLAGIWVLIWWYTFFVSFNSLTIKPTQNPSSKNATEMRDELVTIFQNVSGSEGKIFDTNIKENSLEVSWDQQVFYNQLLNFGNKEVIYKVYYTFDEASHSIIAYTSILHRDASAGTSGVKYFLSWSGGIRYENGGMIIPSFNIKDGQISLDINKLSYGNSVMIDPVIELAKLNGWNVKFVIFKNSLSRFVYSFFGWALFSVGILILFLGLILRLTK